MTVPVQPQGRAVPMTSFTRLAAPREEAAVPPRSRTGALGQGRQRHQAGVRDQVRVVKRRARFRERMQ
jgi:hypothetical protein